MFVAIVIRLPARPLFNIVGYDDDYIARNAAGRRRIVPWIGPETPDPVHLVHPERHDPDQPRKKRMFTSKVDADTILRIRKDLENNEPKAVSQENVSFVC